MACLFPFLVNDQLVPCGKCPQCLVRRTNSWIYRINTEVVESVSADFLTLTYDDIHLPFSPNGFMSLDKSHVQKFIKRLRINMFRKFKSVGVSYKYYNPATGILFPVKYYCCGEYGTRFKRPHYHLILINADCDLYDKSWRDEFGFVIGSMFKNPDAFGSGATAYTTGYMNKKRCVPEHKRDDRVREFSMMSKGIGVSHVTTVRPIRGCSRVLKYPNGDWRIFCQSYKLSDCVRDFPSKFIEFHKREPSNGFIVLPNGQRSALPRYFNDAIFSKEEKEERLPYLEDLARKASKKMYDDYIAIHGNADGYIREQNERRKHAIINFQNKQNERKDL